MDRCQTYQHKSGSRKRKERAARLESIKQGQTLLSKFFVTHGDHSSSNTVDKIVSQHPDAGLTDASDSATTVTAESNHENVGDMPQNSSPIMATSATPAFYQTSQTFPSWNLDLLMSAFQFRQQYDRKCSHITEKIVRDLLVWSVEKQSFSLSAVACFTMAQSNHDHR